MLGANNIIFQILSYVVPALLVFVAFKFVAAATKGYKNFLDAVTVVFSSWRSFFFFCVTVIFLIYLWWEVKKIFGVA